MNRYMYGRKLFCKRILAFLFLPALIFFLAGCWDRIEVNDLAIVTAAAIDQTEEGEVEVALEIFVPKKMGGNDQGGGGGGTETTMVVSHTGNNLAEALSKVQAELSRKVFWGSCKVFIFGESSAKEGIQNHLDYFLRDPAPRERAYAFVSEGKAKKFCCLQWNQW